MIDYLLLFGITAASARIFVKKYDIPFKTGISIAIALMLTIFLNVIQGILDVILNLIL